MIKSIMVYVISFMVLFLLIHYLQDFILSYFNSTVRFNLRDTNLFFAISSFVICSFFSFATGMKSFINQLAYAYLPTLFIKSVLFFLMFQSAVFNLDALTGAERLNLLIPLFLFLGLEVFFIVKIITKNET